MALAADDAMARTSRRAPVRTALRGLLLAAVIAGIFGMHVLNGRDMTDQHGPLPGPASLTTSHDPMPAAASNQHEAAAAAPVLLSSGIVASVLTVATGSKMAHAAMGACTLFLVLGGAVALLMLLRLLSVGEVTHGRLHRASVSADVMRRGPPGSLLPRAALCVFRI